MLTLGKMKEYYENKPYDLVLPYGISEPFSWRGVYAEVAFSIKEHVTVAECLEHVEEALSNTFEGWKGGEFAYDESTEVHFECGEGAYTDSGYAKRQMLEIEEAFGEQSQNNKLFQLMDSVVG
ncbi:conserved hypothetical protein [Vibrio phage 277E43-1]|nr:conserved hypothetical protein [Vibrio phage 277E43-1]